MIGENLAAQHIVVRVQRTSLAEGCVGPPKRTLNCEQNGTPNSSSCWLEPNAARPTVLHDIQNALGCGEPDAATTLAGNT